MPEDHPVNGGTDPVSSAAMPILETERLLIRPFRIDDLQALHRILDLEIDESQDPAGSLRQREAYIRWSVMNYEQLAALDQPPLGDRAIVEKDVDTLVGACGLTPAMGPFGLLPSFPEVPPEAAGYNLLQVGLYYALSTSVRGRGYATEAAQALIDYGFGTWSLWRIVATTTFDNEASMAVMRRLGMRLERNPQREPPWFQVVGSMENPALKGRGSFHAPEGQTGDQSRG